MNNQHTILCVDDEENILRSLKRLLRKEGYRLLTASSGTMGLKILAENDVQLVISDHRMPNMSGIEFFATVNEKYPDVIFLDPMFPERTKSSLVKKEMRILRRLSGDDASGPELLAVALLRVRNRVVVKRPRLAPPLLNHPEPSHRISGKSSRFDVYLV